MVGGARLKTHGLGVLAGSYLFVGSDHEMVVQKLGLGKAVKAKFGRPNVRPREVVADPVLPPVIDQDALKEMARNCTRPYQGVAYRDPPHVKVFFQIARQTKQAEACKRALKGREVARQEWKQERIAAATNGDWRAYRENVKRGGKSWETHFTSSQADLGVDAHRAVHDHFRRMYMGEPVPPFPFVFVPRSPDFTLQELHEALAKGKPGKPTIGDEVSHELLIAIGRTDEGAGRLLAWYNRLLHGDEPVPADWGKAVMVLLPKCPHQAASSKFVWDQRPIRSTPGCCWPVLVLLSSTRAPFRILAKGDRLLIMFG